MKSDDEPWVFEMDGELPPPVLTDKEALDRRLPLVWAALEAIGQLIDLAEPVP
jgi:hypothetical protein